MRNSPREKAGRRRGTYGTYKRETWVEWRRNGTWREGAPQFRRTRRARHLQRELVPVRCKRV